MIQSGLFNVIVCQINEIVYEFSFSVSLRCTLDLMNSNFRQIKQDTFSFPQMSCFSETPCLCLLCHRHLVFHFLLFFLFLDRNALKVLSPKLNRKQICYLLALQNINKTFTSKLIRAGRIYFYGSDFSGAQFYLCARSGTQKKGSAQN